MAALKYGAAIATSDHRELFASKEIDAILIATRHTTHAPFVKEALDAGKHVFVEKPMTLTLEDAEDIVAKSAEKGLIVRVGFNRRFSPYLNCASGSNRQQRVENVFRPRQYRCSPGRLEQHPGGRRPNSRRRRSFL